VGAVYPFTTSMEEREIKRYSQGGLTSGRRPVVKIIAESLSQHDEKHVVPTPLSVGKGRKKWKKERCDVLLFSLGHHSL
jgi:hypothetical protein